MGRLARVVTVAAVALSVGSIACVIGEERFETVTVPARLSSKSVTCSSPFVKPDLGKLKACGDGKGKGHCYDASKIGIDSKELLECEGGEHCLPDKMLLSNGEKLKACTFVMPGGSAGSPGACNSMVIKQVDTNKALLKQDVCDPDERCTPCIHPLDKSDTHICDPIGAHEAACITGAGDGGVAAECCHGAGTCAPRNNLPEDSRGDLDKQDCPSGQLCAPAALLNGQPHKCEGPLGFDGVCVDLCFASMLQSTMPVMRAGCQATEICLPCLIGKGQGMPGCD